MRPMYIGHHAPHAAAPTGCRPTVTADPTQLWRLAVPADPPPLASNAVHVWRVRLDPPGPLNDAWDLLSDEERQRAGRFVHEHHRRRFVAAHGALRRIVAGYTDHSPRELQFAIGPQGKPALPISEAGSRPSLEFNLSHSADLALVAVAWERPVGVDLQQWEREIDHLALAERFFSPAERASLR